MRFFGTGGEINHLLNLLRYTCAMHAPTPPMSLALRARQAFSLVELSVVVAIISVVAVLGLEAAANFVDRTSARITEERLAIADEALVKFVRIYGRLPCPAPRNLIPTGANFGLEDCTIAVWGTNQNYSSLVGGGVMAGMLPFRTLNLPMNMAVDGFGGKMNYVVTKNLTVAGTGSDRFGHVAGTNITNGIGGITIRSGQLKAQNGCTANCQVLAEASPSAATQSGAAYILFSNGRDQRGAVPLRSSTVGLACSSNTTDGSKIDAMNCQWNTCLNLPESMCTNGVTFINRNTFYDSRYNTGTNNKNFFDDHVVWRTKGQL
jgi:prepilin-type N-terminal cleavage/methylation domain-containing protein